MKSVVVKILIVLLIIGLINVRFTVKSYAFSDIAKMFRDADAFVGKGENVENVIYKENLQSTSNFFYRAFLTVAIVIALVVGVVIGVSYIYASVEGQAKLKEAFIPYIFGCFVVFASFPIWRMVINFGNQQGFLTESYEYLEQNDAYEKIKKEGISNATPEDVKSAWEIITKTYSGKSMVDILVMAYNGEIEQNCANIGVKYITIEYRENKTKIKKLWDEFSQKANIVVDKDGYWKEGFRDKHYVITFYEAQF